MKIEHLKETIGQITDPRRQYGFLKHRFEKILIISFCAIICGAEDYEDIEYFGNIRLDWLSKFLDMSSGVPDKDTFRRVFERLNPSEVSKCLHDWLGYRDFAGQTINIDGKTIRGSANSEHKAYHVVSLWASENQMTLGEVVVDEKSNEITAIPQALDLVDIKGAIVTIDAMGCQTEIAKKIIKKKADYCLALKKNQATLYEDVKLYFDEMAPCENVTTLEKDHGRIEKRDYYFETNIAWLTQKKSWAGICAIGAVRSTVWEKEKTRSEIRYYISSLNNAEQFADSVIKHWSIENQLHWQLDVTFGEDGARARKDNSPLNWNIMRKVALPLIRCADVGKKQSIKRKRFMAALDVTILNKILFTYFYQLISQFI